MEYVYETFLLRKPGPSSSYSFVSPSVPENSSVARISCSEMSSPQCGAPPREEGELLEICGIVKQREPLRELGIQHNLHVQCSCSEWLTGNGNNLSNSQACCLAQLCLAPAQFLSISCDVRAFICSRLHARTAVVTGRTTFHLIFTM